MRASRRLPSNGVFIRQAAKGRRTSLEETETMSDDPVIAQKGPYQVTLEAGKNYFWCTCGRSAKQPFCDGSHKGTTHAPLRFVAETASDLGLMLPIAATLRAVFEQAVADGDGALDHSAVELSLARHATGTR